MGDLVDAHFLNQLRATFATHAARPAVIAQGRVYSYSELKQRVHSAAALLQALGMRPGDRVALATASRLPFLLAHLGILYGGGVALPLNPRFTPDELRYFLDDSGARLVVAGPEQRAILEGLRSGLPELQAVVPDEAVADAHVQSPREVQPAAADACLIAYSSGTTGFPKGVVHSHANLATSLTALAACWRFTPEDIVVHVLPLFHIHGLSFAAHLSLLTGAAILLEDTFHKQGTLDAIGRGTVFMAVPTMYYRFLQEPTFRDRARSWERVRLFTCGSAPIRADVLPELESILGRPVINRYGMTEAHVIASLPLDGPWPAGSVGLPLQGIELQVVRADGSSVPAGEVGAVRVRGPNLFREYWGKSEATGNAFASGWFETGDLGSVDAAGFLTLIGRSNDLIITGGYNVYPQVVERVLNACPGVRESAVVGVPDDIYGERVAAAVVRDDPALNEARLRAYCAEHLVDYQRPRRVVFVETLPRNALGKILLAELRQRLR
jgi:malonyl-CoA/methylmalonyl-CoA synthetase